MKLRRVLALLLCAPGLCPLAGWADELSITIGELDSALRESSAGTDAVDRLLADSVRQALQAAGLQLDQGRLLTQSRVDDEVLEDGCSDTVLLEMDLSVALATGTNLSFALESLLTPIELSLDVDAVVDASGRVRQRFGVVLLGNCSRIAQDTFSFTVDGPLQLALRVTVALNPEFLANAIRITPRFTVDGTLGAYNFDVDVDDTLIAGLLEDELEDIIEDALSNDQLQVVLQQLEDDLHQAVLDSWGADNRSYVLPEIGAGQTAELVEIIARRSGFPIAMSYIEERKIEILMALLIGDDALLQQTVALGAACDASQVLLAAMASEPLYARDADACVTADLDSLVAQQHFVDAACTLPVAYAPTPYAAYCADTLDRERLGNAAVYANLAQHWTQSPGTRFDIGAVSIGDNRQPFMTRTAYKTIGECQLEMRIYKQALGDTELKPLLAMHGGSWNRRAGTFYGIESQVSHYTERGFLVFVPFYRLVGTDDGNRECNDVAGDDVVADISDAIDWVFEQGVQYGAAAGRVYVTGQSAGAHLAAWLAVHRPELVDRALLLYPPTDLDDLIEQVASGDYANGAGIEAVERFLATALETLDPASPAVADNSFPQIIAADPAAFPTLFILHGGADDLVPSRQSVRLCNALAGSPSSGPARDIASDPRSVYDCDERGSVLHLLADAGHAFDICITANACPAAAREAAATSLLAGMDWLAQDPEPALADDPPSAAEQRPDKTASTGLGYITLLLALVALVGRRFMR